MRSVDVEGATGNVHTNFKGKGEAAIEKFKNGADLVCIHVEAPDECGNRAETENKVRSIELIDEHILTPVYEYLKNSAEDFKILVLPDHPTPVEIRTHTSDPVPFMMYSSKKAEKGIPSFTEDNAKTDFYLDKGEFLFDYFIEKGI